MATTHDGGRVTRYLLGQLSEGEEESLLYEHLPIGGEAGQSCRE